MTKLHVAPGLSLPLEVVTSTNALLAKRGSGKTYTAAVLAEEMLKAHIPIVAIDPTGAWWGLRSSADGKGPGYPVVVLGGEHGDLPLAEDSGEEVARFIVSERPAGVVLDLSLMRKKAAVRFMLPFIETLYFKNREALHLFWDECDLHIPQKPFEEQARLLGAAEDLVRRGRVKGLGVTLITQRPAVVNKDVLTQTETLIVLRMVGPQDVDAVKAWVKQHDLEGIAPDMLASLPALPVGDAWWWSPGFLEIFKHTRVRERETFDSSRTPKVGEKIRPPKVLAPIDIDRLRETMASAVAKAKENDPKELKRENAALKAELSKLAKKNGETVPRQVDQGTTDRAVAKALAEQERNVRRVFDQQRKTAVQIATFLERTAIGIQQHVSELRKVGELPSPAMNGHSGSIATPFVESNNGHGSGVLASSPLPAKRAPAPATRLPRHVSGSGVGADLPKGEQAILIAAAQYPDGATREQLTILTGYKRSTRDAYVQRLGEKEFVNAAGGLVFATDAGVAALGSDYEPLPTGEELRAYWFARLPEGERKVLEVTVEHYPNAVDRDQITVVTEYKRSTRDAYIQRLGTRKLITAGRDGIRASDTLFE